MSPIHWSIKTSILVLALVCLVTLPFSVQVERRPVLRANGNLTGNGGYRWGLEAIDAPEAWEITSGSPEIVVAVIDGGINFDLPSLSGRRWVNKDEVFDNKVDDDANGYVDDRHGWDFRNGQQVSNPDIERYFHGTFVAGLIASRYNSSKGTGGVAPGIKMMDLRVLNPRGRAFSSDWPKFAAAIRYATENGADIINISLSARTKPPKVVRRAIRTADQKGILVVVSADNGNSDDQSLAELNGVVTVGAVDNDKTLSSFSASSSEVDIAAPGERVLSFKKGGPATGSGTSFAAAHISGSAALLLSEYPDVKKDKVIATLLNTTQDLSLFSLGTDTSSGLVNVNQALLELKSLQS